MDTVTVELTEPFTCAADGWEIKELQPGSHSVTKAAANKIVEQCVGRIVESGLKSDQTHSRRDPVPQNTESNTNRDGKKTDDHDLAYRVVKRDAGNWFDVMGPEGKPINDKAIATEDEAQKLADQRNKIAK